MGKCTFVELWLQNPSYSSWIAMDEKNRHVAKCTLCLKPIDITKMGESALKSHMSGKKHQSLMDSRKANTSIMNHCVTSNGKGPAPVSLPSTSSTTPVLQIGEKNDTLKAEILWALKVINSHYSYNSCSDVQELFKMMFSDSDIAKSFTCGERKCAYICSFGLAPYFSRLLTDEIKNSNKIFVVLFDESHNKFLKSKQMDVHLRTWDGARVVTRYLTSLFIGHATAEIILAKIRESLADLLLSNILQLSMDGPNVNWKVFNDLQRELSVDNGEKLLNIGSCVLHIANNAFHEGAKASGWNVGKFLHCLHSLFKNSPARIEDFGELSGAGFKLPLKFCSHRWLENSPVCERAIDVWEAVTKYEAEVSKKKLPNPGSVSFDTVKKWVKDPLALAKLHFFNSIAKQMKPFLTVFQTDSPVIPFLARDLEKLIVELMRRFVKPEVMDSSNSSLKLAKMEIKNEECVTYSKIDVGFMAEKELKRLSKSLSDRELMEYRLECRDFLKSLVNQLLEKGPLQYSLVRNIKCLLPNLMANEPETCYKSFKLCLNILSNAGKVKSTDCDNILWQYKDFLHDVVKVNSEFLSFDEKKRLDELFYHFLNEDKKYNLLWDVIKKFLLLSHGQASVERGFSVNKELLVENLTEKSIVAQRVICDHISTVGGIKNVILTKGLMLSVRSARQKYMMYLEEQKKEKAQSEKQKKRKLLLDEISEIKKKKSRLEKEVTELQKSADNLGFQAEETKNLMFLTKSNSFRKTAAEKQDLVKNIEVELREKEKLLCK